MELGKKIEFFYEGEILTGTIICLDYDYYQATIQIDGEDKRRFFA